MRRPAYTPRPVPTVLTMKAVIVPTRAPSHQPIAPPTVAPRKARTLDMRYSLGCSGNRAAVAEEDRSWSSIQDVPNLSRSMAKRDAKKVSSIFMKI